MGDTFALHQALTSGARSAVVVGGSYISLGMAEAFTTRGLTVKLVEQAPAVMPTIDMSSANCSRGASPSWCPGDQGGHRQGIHREHDGLVAVGGIETGVRSAVRVDRRMRTNLADVLAAGDCVETHHRLLDAPAYLPLGTTAQ